ncbi:MAG: lysophospholipid acyltransferase family protein [Calditrichaceae bacterium]|jgi:1-acyl-sn-glycerol-3-phosphate acyltransferase
MGLIEPYSDTVNNFIRFWSRTILFVSGIKLEIVGREVVDTKTPTVYMANHGSLFDILATTVAIPGTARFIAKKELFRFPFFAQGMKLTGMIKIDRGNSAKARKTISEAVESMKKGVSVIIFPEGTRSREGNIKPFKKGGVILAINGKFPIIPMAISGSFHIMKKNNLILQKGTIKVHFTERIDTDNFDISDRNKLIEKVRNSIIEKYDPEYNRK